MRTIAVVFGGIVISITAHILLVHLLAPNSTQLIARVFTTPSSSMDWTELAHQWHRFNLISLFIVAPLSGIAVGLFVGSLQTHHVAIIAAICQLPEFLVLFWDDRAKSWAGSLSGWASFLVVRSLPFLAAVLTALVCRKLIRSGKNTGTDVARAGGHL
jgi:hypothetical protein